ncbi:MAG: isoprenyl transferase [Verrucomicrobiota bacterium]
MTESAQEPRTPQHVAIIMDGNGRWAQNRSLPRIRGHEEGAQSIEACLKAAEECGVKVLTLYAFSVENWSRPESEVGFLMDLLYQTLGKYESKLVKEGVRLQAIGRLGDLPERVQKKLNEVITKTAEGENITLVLALSYGSRVEMVEACRSLASDAKAGLLQPEDIDEEELSRRLYTRDLPDPDLLIRTSGEKRLSNFLLWQLSYTELYISPVLWPDFRGPEFKEAVEEYGRRKRRFGAVEESG